MITKRFCLAAFAAFAACILIGAGSAWITARQAAVEPHERPELVDLMAMYQRYLAKSWYAAQGRDWRLAEWYLRKVELTARRVVNGQVQPYPGYDVASLTQAYMLPYLEAAQVVTDERSEASFATAYDLVVSGCNGCHMTMEHAYVEITRPIDIDYTNQRFVVVEDQN
jgi:hypothetical protein